MESINFAEIFTQANITTILAVFGSLGTAFTWLTACLKSRTNFDVYLNGYRESGTSLLLHLQIINKSSSPLVITKISVKLDGHNISADPIPKIAFREAYTVNDVVQTSATSMTLAFPIRISPQDAASGYVFFPYGKAFPELPSTHLCVTIHTSRGQLIEKKLPLSNPLN